jgi:hypothetical protein
MSASPAPSLRLTTRRSSPRQRIIGALLAVTANRPECDEGFESVVGICVGQFRGRHYRESLSGKYKMKNLISKNAQAWPDILRARAVESKSVGYVDILGVPESPKDIDYKWFHWLRTVE